MKERTKQVLILNNLNLPEVQQAIIILRDHVEADGTHIIIEAERIIESYLSKRRKKEARPTGAVLAAAVVVGIAITALAVYGGIMLIL